MNAKEAADKLRPSFHLESMPAEDRHYVKFVEDVATELGVEHTAFNLHQVASALDDANIHQDSNEYPKMLYGRRHHAVEGVEPSTYDARHDYVFTHVIDEDQAHALGSDWVENPADLEPRGDTPIDALAVEHQPVETHQWSHEGELQPKTHPDDTPDKLSGVGAGNIGVAKPEQATRNPNPPGAA